jgi:hypothetical protein
MRHHLLKLPTRPEEEFLHTHVAKENDNHVLFHDQDVHIMQYVHYFGGWLKAAEVPSAHVHIPSNTE